MYDTDTACDSPDVDVRHDRLHGRLHLGHDAVDELLDDPPLPPLRQQGDVDVFVHLADHHLYAPISVSMQRAGVGCWNHTQGVLVGGGHAVLFSHADLFAKYLLSGLTQL